MDPAKFYAELERAHFLYQELEKSEACRDWLHMIRGLRSTVQAEVLRGTLDKFGRNRDDEKRAVLYVLDVIMGHPSSIHKEYEHQAKMKMQAEARRGSGEGPLHGNDWLT